MADQVRSLSDLEGLGRERIEDLFRAGGLFSPPRGCYRGKLLFWLESKESRHWLYRSVTALMFQHCPFGVDFDRRLWWFVDRRLRAGRFELNEVVSRWRETRVFALRYQGSRLPGPIRSLFYDEVKPLDERLCLGIGGLNLTGEPGVMFFFGLEKR